MEDSCVFQNGPLSSWSRGKVFKKGSWRLFKKGSLFIKLLPLLQAGTPPRT